MKVFPMMCHVRAEGSATRIDVYDEIGDGSPYGDGVSAKDFAAQLSAVKGPLDVHINSYGGSVKDGIAITSAIRSHKGPKRTIVDGMACSAASVIMQAGDERIVQPGAMVMIHDASIGLVGNAAEMQKAAAELDKFSDNIAQVYADRAGGTPAQWRTAMRDETWYTADEAVDAGLADKVGDGTAALPGELDLSAFAFVPERIVARLRELPLRAAYAPAPYSHESWENVQCPVCGKFNDDDAQYCGQCGVQLAGRDDVTTTRTASKATGTATAPILAAAAETDDTDGPACRMCAGKGRLPHPVTGKASVQCPGCHGTGKAPMTGDDPGEMPDESDPSNAANGMTVELHDGIHPEVAQAALDWLRSKVKQQAAISAQALAEAGLEPGAALGAVFAAASVDQSDWDGPKAMSLAAKSSDPAATYKEICAGTKAGDPSKQDSWALPYRYPGKPINAAGVRNALSRLPQTQGLTNEAAAKALLERLMKQVNPDHESGDAGNAAPSWITQTPAPEPPAWLNSAKEAK